MNRNNTDYKLAVSDVSKIQPTDLLVISRSGTDYKILRSSLSKVLDSDFALVNRGGVDYKAPWSLVKSLFMPSGKPPKFNSLTLTRKTPGSASDLGFNASLSFDRGKEPASEVRLEAGIYQDLGDVPITTHFLEPGGFEQATPAVKQGKLTYSAIAPREYAVWSLADPLSVVRYDDQGVHTYPLPDAHKDPAVVARDKLDTKYQARLDDYLSVIAIDSKIAIVIQQCVTTLHTSVEYEWYTADGGVTWKESPLKGVTSCCVGHDGKIYLLERSGNSASLHLFNPATNTATPTTPAYNGSGVLYTGSNYRCFLSACGEGIVGSPGKGFFFWRPGTAIQTFIARGNYGNICVSDNTQHCILVGSSSAVYTTNGGNTWSSEIRLTQTQIKLLRSVTTVIDDEGILYTCEPNSTNFFTLGAPYTKQGVWRSADHGATWTLVLEAPVIQMETHGVQRIAIVSPLNPAVYYESDDGLHWTLVKDTHTGVMPVHIALFQRQSGPYTVNAMTYNGSDSSLYGKDAAFRAESVFRTLRVKLQSASDESKFTVGGYVSIGGTRLWLYDIDREGPDTELLFYDPDPSHDESWWKAQLVAHPPKGCRHHHSLVVDANGQVTNLSSGRVAATPITLSTGDAGFTLTMADRVNGMKVLPVGIANLTLQVVLFASNSQGSDRIEATGSF